MKINLTVTEVAEAILYFLAVATFIALGAAVFMFSIGLLQMAVEFAVSRLTQ